MIPLPFVCGCAMTNGRLSFVVGMSLLRKQKLFWQTPIPGHLLPIFLSQTICWCLLGVWPADLGALEPICRGFKPPASILILGAPENQPLSQSKLDTQRQMLLLEKLPEQGLSQRRLAPEWDSKNRSRGPLDHLAKALGELTLLIPRSPLAPCFHHPCAAQALRSHHPPPHSALQKTLLGFESQH